ncbi:iron ABC transporter ATP-binding protein [Spirochaetia bacterium]|nr:iron ABC transporter ATP-binding protein [Spirochaetia bacterium]
MASVLSVDGVGFSYKNPNTKKNRQTLKNISFSIERGEHIALIGPNGSGKTTLFNIICTFLKQDSGKILLNGIDIRSFSDQNRAKQVSFVPQSVKIDFPYTSLELILMARYPHKARLDRVDDADLSLAESLMKETGVWEFASKNVQELSGGEAQKVILTRSLLQILGDSAASEPRLLLLDEAMSALDIAARIGMMKLLSLYARRDGISIIAIHHDLHSVYSFTDRVIALKDGELAADGVPQEVFNAPFLKHVFSVDAEIVPGKGFFVQDIPVL